MAQYKDEAEVCRTFQKLQTNFLRSFKVENHKSIAEELLNAYKVTGHTRSLTLTLPTRRIW
jgi:hypothetical protein